MSKKKAEKNYIAFTLDNLDQARTDMHVAAVLKIVDGKLSAIKQSEPNNLATAQEQFKIYVGEYFRGKNHFEI